MKNIAILGSTGSIGTSTLKVVDSLPDELNVVALSANNNVDLLIKQAQIYEPKIVAIQNEDCFAYLKENLSSSVEILCGDEGIRRVATYPDTDLLVCAIVGSAGLYPTYLAIQAGINIAIATKEVLVVAGDLITSMAKEKNVNLIPIDSEHSALLQCLAGQKKEWVDKLILTASGGPFFNMPVEQMRTVTVSQALAHPRWSMGKKISIDSATMMNKGLELIEAMWLFDMPAEKISILIHPESIIHSMVEYNDGSYIAQMNVTDMTIPIQYALTYPERKSSSIAQKIPFAQLGTLTFKDPDYYKFPCLRLAYEAAKIGQSMTAVLNAANEQAVSLFLKEKIAFVDIPYIIETVMEKHTLEEQPSLERLIEIDQWARNMAETVVRASN
ncbi:MAG: 1-deoxy-D-xylulose-5-phosphate reductoisomerase [Candidatus Auribacterota bacterium]|jgi:1-deoxy-D-xylulose-5-phosphate reductoisomerase|nr:1-deoxy-D-xylulose-5-phosphate reductoisomerase [Candidatus Auribacterota bacterium]